jgi:hypothetical protein
LSFKVTLRLMRLKKMLRELWMWHPLEPTIRSHVENVLIINGSRGVESEIKIVMRKILIEEVEKNFCLPLKICS